VSVSVGRREVVALTDDGDQGQRVRPFQRTGLALVAAAILLAAPACTLAPKRPELRLPGYGSIDSKGRLQIGGAWFSSAQGSHGLPLDELEPSGEEVTLLTPNGDPLENPATGLIERADGLVPEVGDVARYETGGILEVVYEDRSAAVLYLEGFLSSQNRSNGLDSLEVESAGLVQDPGTGDLNVFTRLDESDEKEGFDWRGYFRYAFPDGTLGLPLVGDTDWGTHVFFERNPAVDANGMVEFDPAQTAFGGTLIHKDSGLFLRATYLADTNRYMWDDGEAWSLGWVYPLAYSRALQPLVRGSFDRHAYRTHDVSWSKRAEVSRLILNYTSTRYSGSDAFFVGEFVPGAGGPGGRDVRGQLDAFALALDVFPPGDVAWLAAAGSWDSSTAN
jgi:hypothetical protein